MIRATEEQALNIQRKLGIATRMQGVIDLLIEKLDQFYESEVSDRLNVSFTATESPGVLRVISTPCGSGRVTSSIDMAGGSLEGRVLAEKSTWSHSGEIVWRPVWMARIPEDGKIRLGDEKEEPPLNIYNQFGGSLDDIHLLGNSLLFAIASAPARLTTS